MFQIEALDHVALVARNLQQSIDWYRSVLGMEQRYQYRDETGQGNPVVMGSGDACIALFPAAPAYPISPFNGHVAMRLNRANFEHAQEHLRSIGINFRFVRYSRCDSLYFNDPSGYQIELSTYDMPKV
ncbi:VOC family protein [Ktedonosporobacter rubrisoli]|uniref:VOC family protein n=1 Tax=Ktedonosporobacter rubrisoli TaxID=2509675 RepID=A0A4P6JIK4_KTERU|nr:VOC family protein [Ktedonosporobacter rubrisoli]QBD74904.1 VOC family protein [Ktedonosporobacter rubrisoli]